MVLYVDMYVYLLITFILTLMSLNRRKLLIRLHLMRYIDVKKYINTSDTFVRLQRKYLFVFVNIYADNSACTAVRIYILSYFTFTLSGRVYLQYQKRIFSPAYSMIRNEMSKLDSVKTWRAPNRANDSNEVNKDWKRLYQFIEASVVIRKHNLVVPVASKNFGQYSWHT